MPVAGLTAYAPLANGLLTGKYLPDATAPEDSRLSKNLWNTGSRYLTENKLQLAERLNAFARDNGHTLLELAFAWQLANPLISSVIAGAMTVEQLEQNVAAGSQWRLTADERKSVERICEDFA